MLAIKICLQTDKLRNQELLWYRTKMLIFKIKPNTFGQGTGKNLHTDQNQSFVWVFD